jgi:Fe2+ or Zn2+ uptake regulation protein
MSAGIAERVLERIQVSGGRSTLPTRLVVTILAETDHHLTADDLINEVERRAPGIAPSTVYRVLQRLDELDVLKHVHSGGGAAFYHLREHAHAHLVCTDCGAITDVSQPVAAVLRSLEEVTSRMHGFILDAHHSALLGRCLLCSAAALPTHRGIPEKVNESAVGGELVVVHQATSR